MTVKAEHLPNPNRHDVSFASDKQASPSHHMAPNTPIHTCERKEVCFRTYTGNPSIGLASGICRAILKKQGLRPKPVYLRSPKEQLMRARTGAQLPSRKADPSSGCSPFPAPPGAGADREEGSRVLAVLPSAWKMRLLVCLL